MGTPEDTDKKAIDIANAEDLSKQAIIGQQEESDKLIDSNESAYTPDEHRGSYEGGKRRRKTMKKMSKRKMMKWCKSKKNRRTKAGRKMCKKMKK